MTVYLSTFTDATAGLSNSGYISPRMISNKQYIRCLFNTGDCSTLATFPSPARRSSRRLRASCCLRSSSAGVGSGSFLRKIISLSRLMRAARRDSFSPTRSNRAIAVWINVSTVLRETQQKAKARRTSRIGALRIFTTVGRKYSSYHYFASDLALPITYVCRLSIAMVHERCATEA